MRNTSLFLQAAKATPDMVEKLAELSVKIAGMPTIYRHDGPVDPLDNPDLGPNRAGNSIGRGRNIGKLVGAVGGAALGGLAGYGLGGGAGHALQHPLDTAGSVLHGEAPGMSGGLGEAGAVAGGAAGALAGGMLGSRAGQHIGAGIGKLDSHLASPEAQAAEKIKGMDPSTSLAHIRMMEQSGHATPSVIKAMKDAYETRRTGLQAQIASGVPV